VTDIDIDKTDPVITLSSRSHPAGTWTNQDVDLVWLCSDESGSGVDTTASTLTDTVSTEGENQTSTGTCVDNAGNSDPDTQDNIDVDKTDPGIRWSGPITQGASYVFGSVPGDNSCTATDELSGPSGCSVDGYRATVGSHTLTATATDNAGNTGSDTIGYTVRAWTTRGFYSPVDGNGVYNTVKGGSTVPLKFELFAGPTELTDVAAVDTFTTQKITCGTDAVLDTVEVVSTGGTSLRYDATGGQFIQNWKTPTGAGACYKTTMTADDGSRISALFKIK
jgi:hypothetical protein